MKTYKLLLLILSIALSDASATGLETKWNAKFRNGISYPADWLPSTTGQFFEQNALSIINPGEDININVMAKQFSAENRGLYRSITDVPAVEKNTIDSIRTDLGGIKIRSGKTKISNQHALWYSYAMSHSSLDHESWIAVYQISVLNNDILYTITAKAIGATQSDASNKFNRNWPTISQVISTFTFVK
jgi:hypothetical protein